jgi:hypothetical protein
MLFTFQRNDILLSFVPLQHHVSSFSQTYQSLADSNIYIDISNNTEFQVVPLCNFLQGIFLHHAVQVTFYFFSSS